MSKDNICIIQNKLISTTEFYYSVSKFGKYFVSVAAVIKDADLESVVNTVSTEVHEG